MGALAAADVTVISQVPLNQGPGKGLALIDILVEPTAGVANTDTLDADAIGVEQIRSILATSFIDGNDWFHADGSNLADLTPEKRPRVAHDAAESSASLSSAARANDADTITFTVALARDAAWLQLLVQT